MLHLVSLATTKDPPTDAASLGAVVESSDDDEMVHSYKVMYEKQVKGLNENHDLRKQVSLLGNKKEDLVKQNNMLRDKVSQHGESLCELKKMKKFVRMLNSGTTILEWILEMGKRAEDRGGLGFKGENLGNNILKEETQKGKDHHHKGKTSPPTLRCYYCIK